ncbi:MAG: hypothetical protein SGPRY_011081, partial [Prymnesium sp.]
MPTKGGLVGGRRPKFGPMVDYKLAYDLCGGEADEIAPTQSEFESIRRTYACVVGLSASDAEYDYNPAQEPDNEDDLKLRHGANKRKQEPDASSSSQRDSKAQTMGGGDGRTHWPQGQPSSTQQWSHNPSWGGSPGQPH